MGNTLSAGQVAAVVFDWAGTMVDFGCQAPIQGLVATFAEQGVPVTDADARIDMGLSKPDHITALLHMPSVRSRWETVHGTPPTAVDARRMAERLEHILTDTLAQRSRPVPGAVHVAEELRGKGIRIGSTTGYSAHMMDVVAEVAKQHGYQPDALVTASDVPRGRPWPYMCYLNAIRLDVMPLWRMVKVGDTLNDIQEGRNAGMWTIGVIEGGSDLGLTEEALQALPAAELLRRTTAVRERFLQARADYTAQSIAAVPGILEQIADRLSQGEYPHG